MFPVFTSQMFRRLVPALVAVCSMVLLVAACGQEQQEAPAKTETAAEQEAKTYTVSITQIVEHPALNDVRDGFKKTLTDKGLNVTFNEYNAQGAIDTAQQIASQIQGDEPDLILAIATPTAQAVAQRISDTPILFSAITDPVGAKLVSSLDAPGANISGMTDRSPVDAQLELMAEIVPGMKTVGIIYNAGEANSVSTFEQLKEEAATMGLAVEPATITTSAEVLQAAQSLVGRCDAVYVPTDNTVITALEAAVKVCSENNLPLFAADTSSVERGVIAALAIDYYEMGLQTGEMGYRILAEGAKTATMPVESLKNFQIYVNPAAAEGMGVTIPQSVMDKADEVVE